MSPKLYVLTVVIQTLWYSHINILCRKRSLSMTLDQKEQYPFLNTCCVFHVTLSDISDKDYSLPELLVDTNEVLKKALLECNDLLYEQQCLIEKLHAECQVKTDKLSALETHLMDETNQSLVKSSIALDKQNRSDKDDQQECSKLV